MAHFLNYEKMISKIKCTKDFSWNSDKREHRFKLMPVEQLARYFSYKNNFSIFWT
jgi:hypothetical protein